MTLLPVTSLCWLPLARRLGFTILTYNVLAEIYATPDAYPYCAAWALPWNFRRRSILRELVSYRADIMCLQEVQADHFENFFEPELAKFNYTVPANNSIHQQAPDKGPLHPHREAAGLTLPFPFPPPHSPPPF